MAREPSLIDSVFGSNRGYVDSVFGVSEEDRRAQRRRVEDAALSGSVSDPLSNAARAFQGGERVEPEPLRSRLRDLQDSPDPADYEDSPMGRTQLRLDRENFNREQRDIARRVEETTTPPPPPETWGERGQRFLNRAGDLFSAAFNGWLMSEAESHGPREFQTLAGGESPRFNREMITTETERLISEARQQGNLPGQRAFQAAMEDLRTNEYRFSEGIGGTVDYYLTSTAESLVQMLPTVAAAYATRGRSLPSSVQRLVPVAVLQQQAGAQRYGQSRMEGRDPAQARQDAAVFGLAEAIPEMLPLGAMMREGGSFLRRTLTTAGMEGVSEVMTQAIQDGYSRGVLGEEMTWREAWENLRDAGIIGSLMGGGMGALGEVGERTRAREEEPGDIGVNRDVTDAFDPNFKADVSLSPSDRRSPIPDEDIAQGRAVMDEIFGREPESDTIANTTGVRQVRRRPRPPAMPDTENVFDRMVQITLGSESRNRDFDSNGNVLTSPAGARGRMQVLDGTNTDPGFGVRPAADNSLAERARVGRDYLRAMLRRYDGDPAKMWAAYNWGPDNLDAAIERHGDNWMQAAPAETRGYVTRNLNQLGARGFDAQTGDMRAIPEVEIAEREEESAEDFVNRVLGDDFRAADPMTQDESPEPVNLAAQRTAELDAARIEPAAPSNPNLPPLPTVEGVAAARAPDLGGLAPSGPDVPVSAPSAGPAPNIDVSAPQGVSVQPGAPAAAPAAAMPTPEAVSGEAPLATPAAAEAAPSTMELGAGTVESDVPSVDRPMAAEGLNSFRYRGRYGYVMIGATDAADALREAGRSIDGEPQIANLETWNGEQYVPAQGAAPSPARQTFDPATLVPQLQEYVRGRGALDTGTIAKRLGVNRRQAERVVAALASRPNSGVYLSRSGKLRRSPVARGPVDAIRFLRNTGGIRNDEGNDLISGRNWNKAAPGLISRNGRSIDEAGRALWEAGYFPNRSERPSVDETLEFIEEALRNKAYSVEDAEEVAAREGAAEDRQRRQTATYEVMDLAQDVGLDMTESEIDDAIEYMVAGEPVESAVQRALDDASSRTLYDLADETGRDFYESVAETIYVGEVAEQRDGGPEEGSVGPEGVEGDALEREPAGGESREAGRAQDVANEQPAPVEVTAPEEGAVTPETAPSASPEFTDAEFDAIWKDKAFKAAAKGTSDGMAPHRESSSAREMARGWRDGKARNMAALDAWTDSDAFNPLAYQTRGNNPVVPYVEGFYAAVTGKPTEIRQRGDDRMMGVAKAVDEIETIIEPERAAETRAFVEADNARMAAERSPVDDLFGVREGDQRRALERQAEGRKGTDKKQKAPGEDGGLFDTRDTTADLVQAAQAEPKEKPAKAAYGSKNKLVTADRAAELRERLKAKLNAAQTNAGLDPELIALGTELAVFHIEAGARKFADFAKALADDLAMSMSDLKPYLRGWYNGARDFIEDSGESVDGMDGPGAVRAAIGMIEDSRASENRNKEGGDVSATGQRVEPDRSGAAVGDEVGRAPVPAAEREAGERAGERDRGAEEGGRVGPDREGVVPDDGAIPVGEQGDSGVRGGSSRASGRAEERGGSERGGADRESGQSNDRLTAAAVARSSSGAPSVEEKRAEQKAANSIPVRPGIENIRETLPFLKPGQQDDVEITERRFDAPDGHGMLLTNGTGTGKTFSGGGVIARFYRQGKREIIALAPSQDILSSWQAALAELGVPATILESASTPGEGVTLTTYANFRDNQTLADRKFDLIVPDEAQHLSSNKDGETTAALTMLRAVTNHPRGRYDRARFQLREEWAKLEGIPRSNRTQAQREQIEALEAKTRALAETFADQPRSKALFLSATPFAYVETVDWAEGYLFDYGEADPRTVGRYNAPDARQAFFMRHFGYRMRNGKLTKPEAEVDSGVLERQFHEWLKGQGALSGRMLEIDADYDRRFVQVDDSVGNDIDKALDFLANADNGKFRPISDLVNKKFDYLSRMRLLEAIKAHHAIPMIEEYHRLGRKVVVFHDYNEGGGFNPFALSIDPEQEVTVYTGQGVEKIRPYELYQEFLKRNPYVTKLDFSRMKAPLVTLTRAFPNAIIYNGRVPPKQRRLGKERFNSDAPGSPNLIIIQSAAGEAGISAHDTTGQHMRMIVNLGMPVRPTTAIQEEGRIYREGNVTDAGFRYLNTGTSWERWTFAGKIAERAGTAENLAMGNQARHIRQSFIDAFNDSSPFEAGETDGKGGKERDRAINTTSPFQQAKTFYWAQQKKTGRRDTREGIDYFATPEPIGFKMVEWAGIRFNERALEPSAGHGAIARFLPEYADRTLIEPSSDLLSRAALASPGAKTLQERFEDLNIVNKYDAIVMNPPFGMGGKTAIEHIAKAARHLRNGGRIVAIYPEGPAADRRFEDWIEGESAKGLFLVSSISLPAVTFTRAGTQVRSRILIIDKQMEAEVAARLDSRSPRSIEATTINELFDAIEDMTVPLRLDPIKPEALAPQMAYSELRGATASGDLPIQEKPEFAAGETIHSKTRERLFVASMTARVDRPVFDAALKEAKGRGGYYSSYRSNGAIPGFQFKTEEDRDSFIDAVGTRRQAVQSPLYPYNPTDPSVRREAQQVRASREPFGGRDVSPEQRQRWWDEDMARMEEQDAAERASIARLEASGGRLYTADERYEIGLAEDEARAARGQAPLRPLFSLTGDAPRFNDRITAQLKAELSRMGIGDRVLLKTVDRLFDDPQVAGMYDFGVITLALDNPQSPTFTLNHEAVHALKDLGLFKGDEWRALERAARADGSLMASIRRRYQNEPLTEDQVIEEAVADMYARWRQGRLESGMVRAALQRIREFFVNLYRAISNSGLEPEIRAEAEAVMRAIEAGEFGARGIFDYVVPGEFGLIGPRLSRTDSEEGSPETRWLLSEDRAAQISQKIDTWRTRLQDRMLPLLRTQQRIEAQTGQVLPEGMNPYLAEELMSGKVGARLEKLTDNMVAPLTEAMRKENITLSELETYLYARHAPERNARISDINPDFEEGTGSGMTDAEAEEIMLQVAREGKTEKLERLAARVDDIISFALDTRVEAGLLSEAEAEAWRDQYEFYVPLRGLAEIDPEAAPDRPMFGGGVNVRGPESRRAFGRESKARNILAYSLLQAEEAIMRAGLNDVAKQFYDLAVNNPDKDFWTVDKVTRTPALNRDTGQVFYRTTNRLTAADAPYTVSLKIDGIEHRVTMNRNNAAAVRLAASMRNLHGVQLSGVMRLLGGINRFLSAVNTTFNPEFVITNAFRDIQTASVNLTASDRAGMVRGTLKDYRAALAASVKGSFGKESGEWGKWYREFVDNGGRVYFNRIDDLVEIQRRIERQMRNATGGLSAVRSGAAAVFRFIDKANIGVENAIRLAAYKNGREKGMTEAEAASLAKNLTVNFNRRGEWGTAMNALYLFYNASVQGSVRMVQAMGSKKVRRVLAGAVALGAILEMLNTAISDDDDDGESFYDKISDFDKSRNLIIMIPGGQGRHIKIPLPYGYNIFFNLGRAPMEIARGRRWQDSGSSLLKTIVDSFNPIGGTESLLNFIAPTVADPIVDLSRNRDFAGRPIMPEQSQYGPQVPDSQRYWGSVSPHWRIITDLLNRASGGDEVLPGAIDISPETLEHLSSVVTGAAGTFFFDRVGGIVEKVIAGEEIETNDLPLVRKIVGNRPGWYNKAAFYARMEEIEQTRANLRQYEERGMEDAALSYEDRNADLLELAPSVRRARADMRSIRSQRGDIEQMRNRGDIDAQTAREELRTLREEEERIVNDFNTEYLALIRQPRRPN